MKLAEKYVKMKEASIEENLKPLAKNLLPLIIEEVERRSKLGFDCCSFSVPSEHLDEDDEHDSPLTELIMDLLEKEEFEVMLSGGAGDLFIKWGSWELE